MTTTETPTSVYVAAQGFVPELISELEYYANQGIRILDVRGRLVLTSGRTIAPAWAQNIWYEPVFLPVTSITNAARTLTSIQRNWHLHSEQHHRRAALIQEKLPHVSARPFRFGDPLPSAPLGSWTLWEPDCLLASASCSSPFPDGNLVFQENKTDPPSRAYLKLWEAFTIIPSLRENLPGPGTLCLDMGSAPGGWTWVLATMGAKVFSIDKAPLAPQVGSMPGVEHCIGSGFALDPRHAGAVDWFFSDMICYPDKLYEVISRWLELGECRNFLCTLKCQGQTDHETIRRFAAIPGSIVTHLSCNKHELTWIRPAQQNAFS